MNARLASTIRRHSLAWLVAGNAVGVLLAVLLLLPELNDLLSPFTYGRWVPLHLDWQLYGWCALPLIGVLCHYYLPDDERAATTARLSVWVWSAGLLFGGISWLRGNVGGKLFLDWVGDDLNFWVFAGLVLWAGLGVQARRRPDIAWWAWVGLLALGVVPWLLYRAGSPNSYPAVNPHSGGATGASLLGSTLGVVAIFGLVPWLLRLSPAEHARRAWLEYGGAFLLATTLFAVINHGDASHHRPDQLLGIGSLVIWLPLVWRYARSFVWAPDSRRWLGAAFVWWCLLVLTGWLDFLPGISERVKFTNVLVAHSHLAMAGMVTSLHLALLLNLASARAPSRSFWVWQGGCALHVVALLWIGWRESVEPGVLYVRGGTADLCYGLRLLGGLGMLAASMHWLVTLGRHENNAP